MFHHSRYVAQPTSFHNAYFPARDEIKESMSQRKSFYETERQEYDYIKLYAFHLLHHAKQGRLGHPSHIGALPVMVQDEEGHCQ